MSRSARQPRSAAPPDPEALVARRLAALREEARLTWRELGEKTRAHADVSKVLEDRMQA